MNAYDRLKQALADSDKAPRYLAENTIPNGDFQTRGTNRGARDFYTVHLNDDGTTSLYYTGA